MNKKCIGASIICFILLIVSMFALSACSGNGHTHNYSTEWAKDGLYHWQACSGCEETRRRSEHNWNSGVVTVQPTTTSEGARTYTCNTCGHTRAESIPVLDTHEHAFSESWSSNETHHWHEAICEHTTEKKNYGEHEWNNGVITTMPTTTSKGVKTFTCETCDNTKIEYIQELEEGHSHVYNQQNTDDDYINSDATCVEKATYFYSCSCGEKGNIIFESGSFAEHEYTSLEYSEAEHWYECSCGDKSGIEEHKGGTATCIKKAICSVCSIEYGELKAHNPKQQWETDDTYHWHKCETNGCSYQCNKTTHVLNLNKKCTICDYISSQYLFTITWKNYDGTILEEDKKVLYGTVPTYDGETPIKEKDKQYTYVFSGWAPNIIGATENVTYTAQFNFSANTYKVQFLDYDGSVLEEQEVEYGKDALVLENPERDGYRFIGWDKGYEKITADLTVKALYIEQVSIDFIDYDGSTILTYNIDKGANVEIFPEDPTREYYRFTGWDVDVFENIDSDLTIKATYVRVYDIVFMDYDGTELESQEVVSGESGTFPSNEPKREGYTFIGWEGSVENVTEDRELVALYEINKYSVTFKDVDGTVLLVQENVTFLTSATPPKAQEVYYDYTTDKGYRFTGWDKSYKGITQDTVITAVYGEEIIEPIIFIEEINSVSRKEETVKVRVMIHCDFIIYGVSLNIGFADKLRLSTEVNGEYCKTGENLNYTEAIGHDNVYEFRWSDTNGINFADSKVTETGTITIITLTFTWDSSSINTSQKEIEIFSDSYIINDKLEKQVPVIISSVINIVA